MAPSTELLVESNDGEVLKLQLEELVAGLESQINKLFTQAAAGAQHFLIGRAIFFSSGVRLFDILDVY